MTLTPTATVELHTPASIAAVWDILGNGWIYAGWVVGASRVRAVDPHWPDPGARLLHSFGPWPLVINDHTEVLEVLTGRRLRLKARGWPTGEATVEITTEPSADGGTDITIEEDVSAGPALLVPKAIRQTMGVPRHREMLRRLALLAEGRTDTDS